MMIISGIINMLSVVFGVDGLSKCMVSSMNYIFSYVSKTLSFYQFLARASRLRKFYSIRLSEPEVFLFEQFYKQGK